MKDTVIFDENFDNIIPYAKAIAGDQYTNELEIVLVVAFSDKRNLPSLSYPKKINGKIVPVPLKEYLAKWVNKYLKGYNSRPSLKIGKKSNTHSDPILEKILSARLPKMSQEDLTKVVEGHSLLMTIENLTGDLFEEYLSIKLNPHGWACCWGSSIVSVDFCKVGGRILQIKNSDNSENSSSSQVRNGTKIEKWHRRKSTKKDTFNWNDLIFLTGVPDLSENDFRAFVAQCLGHNKKSIFIDDGNKYLKEEE